MLDKKYYEKIVKAKEDLDKFLDKLGERGYNPDINSMYWWAVRPESAVERAARLTVVYSGDIINKQHYMPATAECCRNYRKVRNAAKRLRLKSMINEDRDCADWPVIEERLYIRGDRRG